MKKFKASEIELLTRMEDGLWHNSNALNKAIKPLMALGVNIEYSAQFGYRLIAPRIFLNESRIRPYLDDSLQARCQFHLFAEINSTNSFLKSLPTSNKLEVVASEMQTEGRGRFGRSWYSPFGENIYCSSRWCFDSDFSSLSGLSLVVSLAIVDGLSALNIKSGIKIKWPNDIYWYDKKLSGSLIEINAESHGKPEVIIGIGLNVTSDHKSTNAIDKPWCSLLDIHEQALNRNLLIATILNALNKSIHQFQQYGFVSFLPQWEKVDYLFGKPIEVLQPLGSIRGQAAGVNAYGQLKLIDNALRVHELSSGDTTLRTD